MNKDFVKQQTDLAQIMQNSVVNEDLQVLQNDILLLERKKTFSNKLFSDYQRVCQMLP